VRYPLPSLLQLIVVGLCVAAPTTRDVENLAQDLRVKKALGLLGTPSDTTIERIIARLPVGPLRAVLREMNHDAWRAKRYVAVPLLDLHLVAIDGKTIGCDPERYHPEAQPQGAGGESGPYILRVLRACLVSAAAQPVLDQMVLPAAGGEPDNFLDFFEALRAAYGGLGMLECVSVDAGFTSRENLHAVHAAGVGFLAGLKGNQPTLYAEVLRLFGAEEELPPWAWEDSYTESQGRRVVTRWLTRQVFPAGFHGWTAPTQIWRIRQRVETPAGGVTWEDRFFLTNLAWDRLGARGCMWAIRLHWDRERSELDAGHAVEGGPACVGAAGAGAGGVGAAALPGLQHRAPASAASAAQRREPHHGLAAAVRGHPHGPHHAGRLRRTRHRLRMMRAA